MLKPSTDVIPLLRGGSYICLCDPVVILAFARPLLELNVPSLRKECH